MSGDEDLTVAQIGAIRQVVKEEIEEHYGRLAKGAIGWVIGSVLAVVASAFAVGIWVAELRGRVDTTERVFITEVSSIKETLNEIKVEVKDLRKGP